MGQGGAIMGAMANRDAGSWAAIVAEAETAGIPHTEVAAKHGVTVAALKYHVYKRRKSGSKPGPRVLPVRIGDERRGLLAEFGNVKLSFGDGCDPAYVAAVLNALGKSAC
jgi:hypothetical protein